MDDTNSILVVGGGIGGMQASLELADMGFHVYLVEAAPAIGGMMAQLDKTFPTNDCAMCMLSPIMVEVGRHPAIEVLAYSEVESLEGDLGLFKALVKRKPRYVHEDRCIACYRCVEACVFQEPKFTNEFDEGLGRRKPVYIPFPQAIPLASIIDPQSCIHFLSGKCRQRCREACPRGAIDFEQREEHLELDVGAAILTTGCRPFDAALREEYGFGRYKNVVTSLQFERILSASGPYRGEIRRPGDGKHPKRIAFIQCVGSRDERGNGYCSSVCCLYTAKEAMMAREHDPELELAVFYIDLRAFSKGFERFIDRASSSGVRYLRSMISRAVELPSGNLLLRYQDGERFVEEVFDLVVLAVGLEPSEQGRELAQKLGIELNWYGFAATGPFTPLETSRRGIYVAGSFSGPKDIPETVVQASGAAAEAAAALSHLQDKRPKQARTKQIPPEREALPTQRIGVFVCHCGSNIAGVVDVESVAAYAAALPGVVHAEDTLYTCSQDSLEHIKEMIRSRELDRVVVASCTPRTHEPLFQETIREAGLNKFLFEMVDIREQCAWVHSDRPARATEKAKELVRMGVAKGRRLKPLATQEIAVTPAALVIGGGLSGMVAALALAEGGYLVHLLEREKELGGNLRRIYRTLDGAEVRPFLEELVARVVGHPKVQTYLEAQLWGLSGFIGNFITSISTPKGEERLEHGAVIVATGGEEYRPSEYLYGQDHRVVTQLELEELLHRDSKRLEPVRSVVMIQCVGSRDEQRPYCSRVCCGEAIKNALSLLERDPNRRIYVLYREMRTYGFTEGFYRQAREKGAIFIRYADDRKPLVQLEGGDIVVTVRDELIGREVSIVPDLLVLSAGIVPDPGNGELGRKLKVPLDGDGFFSEAHVKLRPVDFASGGLFLCGLGHSPGAIPELIARAEAAAGRAAALLSQGKLEAGGVVAQVDPERCTACLTCVRECPYAAIAINQDGVAEVNGALCQGCGICAADCPVKAIQLQGFEDAQELAMVEELLRV